MLKLGHSAGLPKANEVESEHLRVISAPSKKQNQLLTGYNQCGRFMDASRPELVCSAVAAAHSVRLNGSTRLDLLTGNAHLERANTVTWQTCCKLLEEPYCETPTVPLNV